MSKERLTEIDPGNSVLFLGSGFSRDAINICNKNLPTGSQLRDAFARLIRVDSQAYDLRTLADEVYRQANPSLYQILYKYFTVKTLQPYQAALLQKGWLRIYTTNYDDAVELAYHENRAQCHSYNYDDPKPSKLLKGAVIHLHGVIRSANEDNVLDQLILNENSYVRQHFEKSLWYDEFSRDLRFCSACFFVGYALNDYHITALLQKDPAVIDKTYFVCSPHVDKMFANRIKPYGELLPIGAAAFEELCRTLPPRAQVPGPYALQAFRYLDPFKDKKVLAPPTPVEVFNLVAFGSFNTQRCVETLPADQYVVPRAKLTDEAAEALSTVRCLIVHSQLGNGKSIFLYILAHKLISSGYRCYFCRTNPNIESVENDIAALRTYDKTAIFFDSYNAAIEIIQRMLNLPSETKFIVAVRSSIHDVRMHEIKEKLPAPRGMIGLNGIEPADKKHFSNLLGRAGVLPDNFSDQIRRCRDFRDVVVSLYDNRYIKKKIKEELERALGNERFKVVFIVSHLLKWIGQDVDPGFLRSVTGLDAYLIASEFRDIAGDVFQLDDDRVESRSAVFSDYLIRTHFSTNDVLDAAKKVLLEAVKRKKERRYQPIMSRLMQFSYLRRALQNDILYLGALKKFYDTLQRDIYINGEPLFWLQYTILMIEDNNLSAAERFLETAYARAADSPGFETYQIDTQALRLYLLIEEREPRGSNVSRFDKITSKIELVMRMIDNESHRTYAVRVLQGIEPFTVSRIDSLSTPEKNALVIYFSRLIRSLENLSKEVRAQMGSDDVKLSIHRAKRIIIGTGAC